MKCLPLLVIALLSFTVSTYGQWDRQYPLEKLEDVLDIDLAADGYGFASGTRDLLLRFNNQTNQWDLLPGYGGNWRYEAVDYLEGSEGNIAVAGGDDLIMTVNKGADWDVVPDAPEGIHTLKLFSPDHMIAIGDEGAFEWQNDQWTDLEVPNAVAIKGGFILDEMHMWAFTFATDPAIYYTTDGGDTWHTNTDIEDIDVVVFFDALNGTASDGRKIYNTTDGGVIWTLVSNNVIHNTSNDITYGASMNVLMAATANADPAISLDGGVNWTQLATGLINQRSYSIASLSDTEFYVGNDLSGMAFTSNQGSSWVETSGPTRNVIQDVFFVNRLTGIAVGQKGLILRTTNGGAHWDDVTFSTRSHLSVHGIAANDLWIGSGQRIFHSVDTGRTWTESLTLQGGNIVDMLAISSSRILAAGSSGVIYRSDDSGQSWDTVHVAGAQLKSIAKINDQQYMATGFSGILLRSDDQGETWQSLTPPEANLQYEQAYFLGGEGWLVTSSFKHTMWHTDNAGDTWTPIDLPIDRFWDGVYFITPDTGIVVGRSTNEGRVYITFSGGQSWSSGYVTTFPLYGVAGVPNPNGTAWIYGFGSDIEVLPYCDVLPVINNFAGDLFPCEGDTITYSITSENVDQFNWLFPPGWDILGNANEDTIDVLIAPSSGFISVLGTNECGTTGQLNYSAGADLLPEVNLVLGDADPCAGDLYEFNASGVQVDSFQWSFPSDWVVNGDAHLQTIEVFVGEETGDILVTGSNHCGVSEAYHFTATPFVIPDVLVNVQNENELSLSTTAQSYQWYFNGSPIAGATSATYVATLNGTYHAVLQFAQGCEAISSGVDVIISAVSDTKPTPIRIYPNPAKEMLFLEGLEGSFDYRVRDMAGHMIDHGTAANAQIGLGDLQGGIYLLEIKSADQRYIAKFVVK